MVKIGAFASKLATFKFKNLHDCIFFRTFAPRYPFPDIR